MGAQASKEQSKGSGKQLCTLSAHGAAVLQVLLHITPEDSGRSTGSVCHGAGTVTKGVEELGQSTRLSQSMDLSIATTANASGLFSKCSTRDLRIPKTLPKNLTLKGIPHTHHFTKHQRPADTEAAQWIIQATFIGAFQVYNGFTDGCKQLRCRQTGKGDLELAGYAIFMGN